MDEPVFTIPFIKYLLIHKKYEIVGLATTKGNRMSINKNKSKLLYLISLLLIMGIPFFMRNTLITIIFRLKKTLSKFKLVSDPSITTYANKMGIESKRIKSPNSRAFIEYLKKLDLDVIINQSQNILKSELFNIPKLGTLNRHNAILPRNRGRLATFWVLYRNEPETGVSIHFVEEGIDSGDIILQEIYPVQNRDTFRTLVTKNYEIAPKLMISALDLLDSGYSNFMPNNDELATYNSTPKLKEALKYRISRIKLAYSIK